MNGYTRASPAGSGVPDTRVGWECLSGLPRTRPPVALGMLEREVESGVSFTWPTGDEVCPSRRELPPWLVNRLLGPAA